MSNKDLYKDEFGVYREVDDEEKETIDGLEDDEQDHFEEDDADEDSYDLSDDDDEDAYDEDEDYLNERQSDSDIDDD